MWADGFDRLDRLRAWLEHGNTICMRGLERRCGMCIMGMGFVI